ncbi:protein YgfX [Massilia sp. CFBP 13721]|uniref:protein YgfX n=1 Tax=Massilia sp. CFBP 13721 TaxID=2775300 RepID=UPI0035A746C7
MSLAVSARIAPSRRLRTALLLFALAQLCAAFAVGILLPERVAGAPFCAAFFLLTALCSLRGWAGATKTHRIDVSGTGAMHLTVQQEMGADALASTGTAVTLLPATLIWPSLLLLHLADADGTRHVLPVLRDSLAPAEYRALRVAIGTLSRCHERTAPTTEIL